MEPKVASLAMAASTKYLLEHIDNTVGVAEAFDKAPEAACRLLAAGALYLGLNLESTMMDVTVDGKGQVTTTVSAAQPDPQSKPVTVEETASGRVYHIQNLHYYLNVNEVQQLNVNPQEVINQLTDELTKNGL